MIRINLRDWAQRLEHDVAALWLAARDPRVPWFAKALAGAVAAYALSPIDLIPDFLPIIGYLDDLLIVPAGIWLAVRLIPPDLLAELRRAAKGRRPPRSRAAAAAILLLWVFGMAALTWWLFGQAGGETGTPAGLAN